MNKTSFATRGLLIALYLVMMVAVIWLMASGRRWALQSLSTAAAQEDWENWRDEVRRHSDPQANSVARRIPKSNEPPALVLMRDYFGICLTGALLFTSLLYLVMVWLIVGAWKSSSRDAREI